MQQSTQCWECTGGKCKFVEAWLGNDFTLSTLTFNIFLYFQHEILIKNNVSIDNIAFLIPHQPSIGILKEIAQKVNLPFEKVKTNMDRYANTSGGTIPIVLDETHRKGEFKEGDLLLFAAVGAGWTWGTALYKW